MPRYSKRHYDEFAAMFNNTRPVDPTNPKHAQWALLANEVAYLFEKDNPKFNVSKFFDVIYGIERQ